MQTTLTQRTFTIGRLLIQVIKSDKAFMSDAKCTFKKLQTNYKMKVNSVIFRDWAISFNWLSTQPVNS